MDNDSRQRVWKYLLSRSDELAVDLLPVDRIAAPIEEAHWYVAIAALHNEVLARAHERAAGPTSFALVKSIADNNLLARQRIRNEHAMCQTVVQSIRAANASAEFASMVSSSASARSLSSDAPSGSAGGAASARSAPTSLSGLNSGGSSSLGGSSGAGAPSSGLGAARYGNTFRGAASNSSSLLASSTWPRLKPVPATAAKVILAPVFPTSAPEPDAVSNNADIQFVAALRLIALHRPLDVPRVVKRFLFSTLRVPQARAWRGPSLSVCLPRSYIRLMMVNPAELAAQAPGGSGGSVPSGPALPWGSDTQTSGDNTPTSYRSQQLCGGDSGAVAFGSSVGGDEDGRSSCVFGEEGSAGEGEPGSGGGSPISLSALVGGGAGDASAPSALPVDGLPSSSSPREASLSIMSDSLWSAEDEEEGAGVTTGGEATPQLGAVSATTAVAEAAEAAAEAPTALPVLQLSETRPQEQQQQPQQEQADSTSEATPRPKSLVTAKSAKELRAAWMAAASGPSTPVASATAPATDRSGGASGRRGSASGGSEPPSLPPIAPLSTAALSPGAFSPGSGANAAVSGSVWSPTQAGTPPPLPGSSNGWATKTTAAVASPEPGPGFYADAAQATPPNKGSGSVASPAAASPAAEASASGSTSGAWEPQVLDLVRTMTEVAGNHSSGAKLSVLAGIFKALYTPPLSLLPTSSSGLGLAGSPAGATPGEGGEEGGAAPSGGAPELSLPGPAPVRAVRYGRSTGTSTPLMSSRTVSDETSPNRALPASLAGTAVEGATPRLSPAALASAPTTTPSLSTPASNFLVGISGSRAAPGLPVLSLEPAVLDQAGAPEEGAASPSTPAATTAAAAPSGPTLVHGVPVVLDEAKASEARAVLQAALEDIRTFCVGFARGVLYRYPVLGALPARLPRTSGGSAEDGSQDHGMSGPQMNLLQQGVTRVSGSSASGGSSSSGGGGGLLAGVKRVTGVGRQSQTLDETAIIGASREAVLSWGRVNPATNPGAAGGARAGSNSTRRGSASSTGSSGSGGMPVASDTIDCTKLVLRIVQEAFYSFIFPTLYPLIRQAYVSADAEWAEALPLLQAASPCVFGLRPLYCEYGSSCPQHAALPADTEAIDASVGLFKCVGPSPAARAAVLHAQAITTLRLLPRQRTPLGKANALRACMQAVTAGSAMEVELEDAEKRYRASQSIGSGVTAGPVGADDMMPRLCFIVAQAGISSMFTELAYLEHCLPQDRTLGEDGYAIVSLRGALMHCLDLAGEMRQREGKAQQ